MTSCWARGRKAGCAEPRLLGEPGPPVAPAGDVGRALRRGRQRPHLDHDRAARRVVRGMRGGPQHAAIVGFNDLDGRVPTIPPLTRVLTLRDEVVARAAALLTGQMRGPSESPPMEMWRCS